MPRLPPLAPDEWPETMGDALAALRPTAPRHPFPSRDAARPKGLNALGLLARHPELTRAFNTFNGHVLFGTTLSARQRELLVLRVAALRDATYEWVQHVVLAGDAGITPDEIDRISQVSAGSGSAEGSSAQRWSAEGWSTVEGALLAAAEELLADARIGDATYAALAAELDEQQLMDVVFTVGAYDLVAMAFRTFDVELDDDLRKWSSPE